MDRSVDELVPDPPAWWRRGQPMRLTIAAVAQHVAVQEDIDSKAASAGDEPAAAGDGAGADPSSKRCRTHMPLAVKEWFCFLACVRRDWTIRQCFSASQNRHSRPCSSTCTSILPASGSRRRLPVPLLAARAPWNPHLSWSWKTSCPASAAECVLWRRSLGRTPERAPGDTWRRLPLLHSPVSKIHAITSVLFQDTQGRAREGVTRSNDTDTPRAVPTEDRVDIGRCVHH